MPATSLRAHLIANTKSGKGAGASLPEIGQRVAVELGKELVHYPTEDPQVFESQIDKAVAAARQDGGTVIAAGGDGTIRAVAEKAAIAGVSFGVVACGTFNFFARNHQIPEDCEAAFRLALTGEKRPVRLGKINDHLFLINASLGLYAKSIKEREVSTKRFGRARLVVILSSIKSMFSLHKRLKVDLLVDGKPRSLKTISVFIGNNALQLRDLAFDIVRCMKQDLLAVVILKPVSRWELLRILWRGIAKTLEKDERLESFCVEDLTIHLPKPRIMVALDGEMFLMSTPLKVEAVPAALNMVLPPKGRPA